MATFNCKGQLKMVKNSKNQASKRYRDKISLTVKAHEQCVNDMATLKTDYDVTVEKLKHYKELYEELCLEIGWFSKLTDRERQKLRILWDSID